jgi:type I restriction enzyme S subunit
MSNNWPNVKLGDVLMPISRSVRVEPTTAYSILGAHWYARGLYTKDILPGSQIQAKNLYRVEKGDFVYNRLFGWKGSFAIVSSENHNCYVSNEFPCFIVKPDRADGEYIWKYFSLPWVWDEVLSLSTGGTPTSRNRLKEEQLLSMAVPLPPLEEQRRIVARIEKLSAKIDSARDLRAEAEAEAGVIAKAARNIFFVSAAKRLGTSRLEAFSVRITKGESPEWQGYTYQEKGPLFIRSENVLWGVLDPHNAVHIPVAFHKKLSRSQLRCGDVLINLVGASIGRACAVPDGFGAANVNQAVGVITPRTEEVLPEFLVHFLLSPSTQDVIHGGKVETARPNISLGTCGTWRFRKFLFANSNRLCPISMTYKQRQIR